MKSYLGPRAARIYDDLRSMIEDGRLALGASLPSRQELARQYGVAVMTVGQAVERLEREGFLEARIGSGTYVRSRVPEPAANSSPLHSVIDTSPLAIITFDLEGAVTSWNPAAERIFGWTAEEAVGRMHPAVPEGIQDEYTTLMHRVASGETISGIEPPRRRKDGSPVHVSLSLAPIRDGAGQIVGAVTFAEDITSRREQAAALREQVALLELAQEAIMVRELATNAIRYWSAGAEALYGWTREEAIGTSPHELLRTRLPQPLAEIDATLLSTGRWTGELEHTTRDGRHIVVESRWALHRDESGEPSGALEVNRDVTLQREQAAALRRREASFRAMFDRASIGMGMATMDGKLVESNRSMQRFIGYSGEELRRLTFRDFTHPHDLDIDVELAADLVAGRRETYQLEKRYLRKDGRVVWGHLTVSLIRDDEGRPDLAAVMIEDITPRKVAEAEVRSRELRYHDLVESAHDLVLTLDRDGYFTSMNRHAEHVTGYTREEVPRLNIVQIVAPAHRPQIKRAIAEALGGGQGTSETVDMITKAGAPVRVEMSIGVVSEEDIPAGVQLVGREVSETPAGT